MHTFRNVAPAFLPVSCLAQFSAINMEIIYSTETSVECHRAARLRYNPKHLSFHEWCRVYWNIITSKLFRIVTTGVLPDNVSHCTQPLVALHAFVCKFYIIYMALELSFELRNAFIIHSNSIEQSARGRATKWTHKGRFALQKHTRKAAVIFPAVSRFVDDAESLLVNELWEAF